MHETDLKMKRAGMGEDPAAEHDLDAPASAAGDGMLFHADDAIVCAKRIGHLFPAGGVLRPGAVNKIFVFMPAGP